MVASYMPTGEIQGLGRVSGTAVSFTDFLLGFVLAASNTVAGKYDGIPCWSTLLLWSLMPNEPDAMHDQ